MPMNTPVEPVNRPKRTPRRFQPARATLLLLILSTGMFGYTATQALTHVAGPGHPGQAQPSTQTVSPPAVQANATAGSQP